MPDPTPVLNVEEDGNDYSEGEDKDKESVVSEVMMGAEMSGDQVTTDSKEKENEPVSELNKGATREVEEPPKSEALMSVEDQGVVSATLSDEDGADEPAVSLDK